jgi:hypothetical protein
VGGSTLSAWCAVGIVFGIGRRRRRRVSRRSPAASAHDHVVELPRDLKTLAKAIGGSDAKEVAGSAAALLVMAVHGAKGDFEQQFWLPRSTTVHPRVLLRSRSHPHRNQRA